MENQDNKKVPKVFISYSHDSPTHKKWVGGIASILVENGIDVILDQWDLGLGDDIAKFMESSVSQCDRVLLICTESYVRKADEGKGGVGYESMIVTGELIRDLGSSKFIPILRQEGESCSLPKSVSTRFYVNFNEGQDFEGQLELLLRELHQEPAIVKPPLGKNPFSKQPSGVELPIIISKFDPIPDITKFNQDASLIYNSALDVARQGDFVSWRKIISQVKIGISDKLFAWRKKADARKLNDNEFIELIKDGISIYQPLISIAIAGVESGRDKFNNQISILDEILYPSKWEWSGSTGVVFLPFAIAYIYQGIHGAMGAQTHQLTVSINLACSKFTSPMDPNKKALFLLPHIIGWPQSFGGNSSVAWNILTNLPNDWPWLNEAFGNIEDFQIALCSYYMALNILEFSYRVSINKLVIEKAFGDLPLIPPVFHELDRDLKRKAYRLMIADPKQVKAIWHSFDLQDEKVKSMWPEWIKVMRKWASSLSPNRIIDFGYDLEHKDLFDDI